LIFQKTIEDKYLQNVIKQKGSTFWNRVIFSDESSFTLPISKKAPMNGSQHTILMFCSGLLTPQICLPSKIFGEISNSWCKSNTFYQRQRQNWSNQFLPFGNVILGKNNILSLPRRCAAVIKQKGFFTKYWDSLRFRIIFGLWEKYYKIMRLQISDCPCLLMYIMLVIKYIFTWNYSFPIYRFQFKCHTKNYKKNVIRVKIG